MIAIETLLAERDTEIDRLKAALDAAEQRAEDADTECSAMVSARDLTIRDLRAENAAMRGVVEAARAATEPIEGVIAKSHGPWPDVLGEVCLECLHPIQRCNCELAGIRKAVRALDAAKGASK